MSQSTAIPNENPQLPENSRLPNGWELVRLGDVCSFIGGMQPPKHQFKSIPQPGYVRLVQIQDFRRPDRAVYIPLDNAKRTFDETDVMIGRYGPPVFQILRGLSGAYNVALMKTVPKENLLKDFLFYLLQDRPIQRAVIAQSERSAGQSGVQKEFIENLIIPLPPISEQKRIAMILREQMAAVGRARATAEAQLQAAKALPAAYLREIFDAHEARQWERKPLKDYVLSYRNGFGRRPKELEQGAIVLRLADVSSGFVDVSNPRRGAMSLEEFSTYQLLPSDVLFVRVNGSSHLIGRCIPVNLNRNDLAYNDHLIRVRLHDGLDANYLKAVCDLPEVRAEIVEKASTSAGQLTINQDVIASIKVPIAPLSEQHRIVTILEGQTQTINRTIKAIQVQLDLINKLPAALLSQAFTGKL